MINYILILCGLLLVIVGFRQLLLFTSHLNRNVKRLEHLFLDRRFTEIEYLNKELDELNYSYYEILDDINERVSKLEGLIKQAEVPSADDTSDFKRSPKMPLESKPKVSFTEQDRVKRLIDQGFSDVQIAKILNIGSGKVSLIRQIHATNKI